jgi:zinc transporter, ZIP family
MTAPHGAELAIPAHHGADWRWRKLHRIWVGHGFTSEAVSVVFLTLATGSIIYIVIQLLGVAARSQWMDLVAYGLCIGLFAGFLTDAIVTAGGA